MTAALCFALGIALTLIAQHALAVRRASRMPPSESQTADLLAALSVWAEKFTLANPKKKCFKVREAELYEACTKVGLMWLRPRRGKR